MTQGRRNKLNRRLSKIEELLAEANEMKDKMEETYENASDKWKESEAGDKLTTEIGEMDDYILGLEQAETALQNLTAE